MVEPAHTDNDLCGDVEIIWRRTGHTITDEEADTLMTYLIDANVDPAISSGPEGVEITIMGTSLKAITDALHGALKEVGWLA